jgi:hypothetical protein
MKIFVGVNPRISSELDFKPELAVHCTKSHLFDIGRCGLRPLLALVARMVVYACAMIVFNDFGEGICTGFWQVFR